MHRRCCTKEAGEEDEDSYDQELYSDTVQFIPAAAILQPGWVGLLGFMVGDALLMGTSIAMVKTMMIAHRSGGEGNESPGPLDMGRCSKTAPRMSKSARPYQKRHRLGPGLLPAAALPGRGRCRSAF